MVDISGTVVSVKTAIAGVLHSLAGMAVGYEWAVYLGVAAGGAFLMYRSVKQNQRFISDFLVLTALVFAIVY